VIAVDFSTAVVLYVVAYLGLVLACWCRYEWRRSRQARGAAAKHLQEDSTHGHVDRAQS